MTTPQFEQTCILSQTTQTKKAELLILGSSAKTVAKLQYFRSLAMMVISHSKQSLERGSYYREALFFSQSDELEQTKRYFFYPLLHPKRIGQLPSKYYKVSTT